MPQKWCPEIFVALKVEVFSLMKIYFSKRFLWVFHFLSKHWWKAIALKTNKSMCLLLKYSNLIGLYCSEFYGHGTSRKGIAISFSSMFILFFLVDSYYYVLICLKINSLFRWDNKLRERERERERERKSKGPNWVETKEKQKQLDNLIVLCSPLSVPHCRIWEYILPFRVLGFGGLIFHHSAF